MFKRFGIQVLVTIAAVLVSLSSFAHGDHGDQPLAAHLVFKQGALHMHAGFQSPPVVGKESILILEAKNPENHQPVDLNDSVEVALWMPSMGHGSSPVTVERLDTGTYRASEVFFTMKGDWEIRIQLKEGDEVRDQAIVPITL